MSSLTELLIVGVVAGLIIGLFPGESGANRFRNILIGIVGAILGSFLYKQFLTGVLNLSLPSITLDLNQVVIALIGAVLFLLIITLVSKRR